jgi:Xaa-Pro aminopeptidase
VEGKPRILEAAMSFTVEPGIYVDEREEIEVARLEYDLDEWLERTLVEGPSARKELDKLKDGAEKLRHPIPEEFRGIGVRIEDDILITEDGHENLSHHVPTDIDDIEALAKEQSWLMRV